MLRGFSYVDNKGTLTMDTDFGTIEKTSDRSADGQVHLQRQGGLVRRHADRLRRLPARLGRRIRPFINKDGTTNQPGSYPAEPTYLFDTASTTGLDQTQKPTCADGDKSSR